MGRNSLHDAISCGDSVRVHRLLTRSSHEEADQLDAQSGWTPLCRAVICGHYNVVKCLLRYGVDPNRKTAAGETPLHMAVDASQYRLCRVLLEYSADPNQRNDYGETPLHLAVSRNDPAIASLLLSYNADPGVKDYLVSSTQSSQTPLSLASAAGDTQLLEALRATGKSVLGDCPSVVSSRRSCRMSASTRSRSASSERVNKSIPCVASETYENNMFSVYSTCDSDQTQPSEIPMTRPLFSTRPKAASESQELKDWLQGLHLDSIAEPLIDAGFSSTAHLVHAQTALTREALASIGVSSLGAQLTLLAALELEGKYISPSPLLPLLCCGTCTPTKALNSVLPLRTWLTQLRLDALYPVFVSSGFTSLEQLLAIMHTRWALTDATLHHDMLIEKLGHRHRILSQLLEDAKAVDPYELLLGATGLRTRRRAPVDGLCCLM